MLDSGHLFKKLQNKQCDWNHTASLPAASRNCHHTACFIDFKPVTTGQYIYMQLVSVSSIATCNTVHAASFCDLYTVRHITFFFKNKSTYIYSHISNIFSIILYICESLPGAYIIGCFSIFCNSILEGTTINTC